jgi:hypothetical protein
MVCNDYGRPVVAAHEFIKQYRSFTSMLCNGVVGRPWAPFCPYGMILARSTAKMPGKRARHGSGPFLELRNFLISDPTARLRPIRPKRNSDKSDLRKLADRIVGTQYGDHVLVGPRILTLGFVAEESIEIGNGAAILWTNRVDIVISANHNCGSSSRESDHALNGLLWLSLPMIASTNQYVKGSVERRDFPQLAPFQVRIRNWKDSNCSLGHAGDP